MSRTLLLLEAFEQSLSAAQDALDANQKLAWLERAHLIAQQRIDWHWRAHWQMLKHALSQADYTEAGGQVLRLALVPLGHFTGRLPAGNVGSTRMSPFERAPLPDDLAALLASTDDDAASEPCWPWFALAAAMLLADQLTKAIAAAVLPLGDYIPVTSFFNLVHVLNPGAAFSFLAEAGGWQRYAFSVLGILVSLWLSFEIWRGRVSRLERFAYAMVMGGALGNVVDRLWQGAVTDFLDFYWGGSHFPAFNVADIAINVGVVALVVAALRDARKAEL